MVHLFVCKSEDDRFFLVLISHQDPYFPHGIMDLRFAVSCEPVGETELRLRTNQKAILLSADSVPSRDEWVKAIRKVMFKAQNLGASVKVSRIDFELYIFYISPGILDRNSLFRYTGC